MLYHLLYPLHNFFSPLNVFQYISFRAGGALLTALALSFVFAPLVIRWLKGKKVAQEIRSDGPATHLAKKGTPTMGGLIILLSLVSSTLLWGRWDNRFLWIILFSTLYLGLLGFVDDYRKWIKKNPRGLSSTEKMFGQFGLALLLSIYIYFFPSNAGYLTKVGVPYFKYLFIDLGSFYIFFTILVIIGTSNAVNLTDGLDGLAIGAIIFTALTYAIFAYLAGHAQFSSYLRIVPVPGAGELTIYLAAIVGSGLGFLWFNSYPAEIFMGDTGSLFLGGVIGIIAILIKQELILLVVGGVFVLEVVSVILQVASFRIRGKRIFRMAPLHHHFELLGWAEPKVTIRFWIIAIILAILGLSSLKLR
ncbi:MAG: phospho-N-acetylmuramoyl-pentapeptide-transferase [Elusimicrobiota bacterium]